jgi:hypothetical protein
MGDLASNGRRKQDGYSHNISERRHLCGCIYIQRSKCDNGISIPEWCLQHGQRKRTSEPYNRCLAVIE